MDTTRRKFIHTASGLLLAPAVVQAADSQVTGLTKPKIVPAGEGRAVWAMGIHVTVRVTGEDTNGAYSVFEDVVPPGGGPPPHTHTREDETMFVLEGELEATLGDQTAIVRPGTFVHMARGTPHFFKNKSGKPARMLLTYTPGGFEQWFFETGTPATQDTSTPPAHPTPEQLQRAVAAAERYGVTFAAKGQAPAR
jgi:quercetin dioxygenase-like cupin family protein